MVTTTVARIGSLIGDSTRIAMLQALMGGRALTATELALSAGVTPQTASGHLAQLTSASLVSVVKQGRHKYFRIANLHVARLLESMMLVASNTSVEVPRTGPRDAGMRLARSCYDHIAGWVGVSIADAFVLRGWIEMSEDSAIVTPEGLGHVAAIGIDLGSITHSQTKSLCRPCLDWSERRPHLAGRLGSSLYGHAQKCGWMRRQAHSRALDVTPAGWRALRDLFAIDRPTELP